MAYDKKTEDKIEQLCDAVAKEEKSLSSSLNKALIFYVVIVILLGGYTLFLNAKIRQLATPSNLACLVNGRIRDSIPQIARNLEGKLEPGAKQMALHTVKLAGDAIPKLAEIGKAQLDFYAVKIAEDVEHKHFKQFQGIFMHCLDEVAKNKDLLKDKNLGKAISADICKRLDAEVGNIIDSSFFKSIDDLKVQLDELRIKKVSRLTKRDYAEKMFIIYWLYLVNNKEAGKGLMGDLVTTINNTAEQLCRKTEK
ncbi:hypothetical protein P0136_11020 [Lentisphaerota bacterium ZTH]|nr:hypothetical protein JYG24_11460 [Lentisphaerota bacterium]WET05892.1 hypothetical protein P0136_11020 [Lentisphaerota bacterium ZTH]